MASCFQRFLHDESGLVVTAELIMIITIAVISLTAGWSAVSTMMSQELEDVANSFGALNQSYSVRGLSAPGHAFCIGSRFIDSQTTVNVLASSNVNTSVAGRTFTPIIPRHSAAAFAAETTVAEEQCVLVEEEFGIDIQIDQALLLELQEAGIVTIREDGSVILLREDLIEICDDGSIRRRDGRAAPKAHSSHQDTNCPHCPPPQATNTLPQHPEARPQREKDQTSE